MKEKFLLERRLDEEFIESNFIDIKKSGLLVVLIKNQKLSEKFLTRHWRDVRKYLSEIVDNQILSEDFLTRIKRCVIDNCVRYPLSFKLSLMLRQNVSLEWIRRYIDSFYTENKWNYLGSDYIRYHYEFDEFNNWYGYVYTGSSFIDNLMSRSIDNTPARSGNCFKIKVNTMDKIHGWVSKQMVSHVSLVCLIRNGKIIEKF